MDVADLENTWTYHVVLNHEEQYSIWPEFKGDPPPGWRTVGKTGPKSECLAYIKEHWTDMRPLSLRKQMEELERNRAEIERTHAERLKEEAARPKDPRDNLVSFLASGNHPVEVALRPERTGVAFGEAFERGYVHVRFTDTRGGTELGLRVDRDESRLEGEFAEQRGSLSLVGTLVLNYVPVRCEARIDLATFTGVGRLVVADAPRV